MTSPLERHAEQLSALGHPVRLQILRFVVQGGDVQPADLEGLSLAEAIDINERSHRFDGVERIEDDGTVVFCPQDVQVLRETLGCDCQRLKPAESEERARELMARFREYAARHGAVLPR